MAKDPDEGIVPIFKNMAFKNEAASIKAGRPIFEDTEVVELHYPGSRNVGCFPATDFSHWATSPVDGSQYKISYAERFRRQYQQFKSQETQTKAGTPLSYALFLTEARRAELRALNVYTIEALAGIDGQELKNLGMNGRELKNKAMEYIEEAKAGAPNAMMIAELETLRARNALLEEDIKTVKTKVNSDPDSLDDQFENMSLEALRDYITTNTGQAPMGTLNRRNLLRLARDATSSTKAA